MRKLLTICAAVMVTACVFADTEIIPKAIAVGTNTGAVATNTYARGFVEDIAVWCVGGGMATMTVYTVRSGFADVAIASATISTNKIFRPCVDFTDSEGSALTNDTPRRIFLLGEKLRYDVSNSPTGKTWRVEVKTTEQ